MPKALSNFFVLVVLASELIIFVVETHALW